MMNKKFLTMMFSLLLAVGWTSDATAQVKEMRVAPKVASATIQSGAHGKAVPNQQGVTLRSYAPSRTNDYSQLAPAVHDKAWYEQQPNVTWGNNSAKLTVPYTDPDGMIALLKRIYTDRLLPGAKRSAPRSCDLPYQTIQHGWGIIGTNYLDDAVVRVNSNTLRIYSIEVNDLNGQNLATFTPSNNSSLSGWSINYNNYGYYWYASSSSGASLTIPAEYLENTTGGANVVVNCFSGNSSYATTSKDTVFIGNQTFDYQGYAINYSSNGTYWVPYYTFPGTITPPDENGYTVCLVKLYDGINTDSTNMAPEYTATSEELRNYFQTYIKEIQLLTDGLRVGTGGDNPGTVFSYTGKLNRFFFIGKGKMFYYSSIDGLNYDRAPFFSMFEEFSANDVADQTGFTDFYIKMMQRESYPIVHDCMGVNYRQHYFSMAGKQGTAENDVSSLVFFIPDYRGVEGSDWRTYDVNHQPRIGMYIITLDAEAHASTTQEGYYDVVVNWDSNLDDITNNTVPQTYKLYEIMYNKETGKNDTTLVYTGPNTTWTKPYKVGEPDSYPITYYVVGQPVGDDNTYTNPDFYDKSNDDEVIIPGENDFLALYRLGYESDYVIGANENDDKEKNYYRNYLSVQNLEALGDESITPNTIGTGIRTLVLYRLETAGETIVAYLDLMMEGNKPYYRIRYVKENQDVEPGFTGPTNYTTNN